MPYVYMCVHNETGQFYIGSRTSKLMRLPSHLDLPRYRTSSKVVKPIFDQFDWVILAEFLNPTDAYDYEQQLILNSWGNPLLLNKNYTSGGGRLFVTGIQWSDDRKQKASAERRGKLRVGTLQSTETKAKISASNKGKHNIVHTDDTKRRMSAGHKDKKLTPEHRRNISSGKYGIRWWNNGVISTQSKACPSGEWVLGRLPLGKRM